jgi:peptide/nickel transport system permease protein
LRRWRLFFKRGQNILGLAILGFFVLVALFAPYLAPPVDPDNPGYFKIVGDSRRDVLPQPPSEGILLGTTSRQEDIFYTLVWGTRATLRFGLIVALTTAILGTLVGVTSGYLGGGVNFVVMRITDAFLAFPLLAGVLLLFYVLLSSIPESGPPAWLSVLLRLGLTPVMLAFILFSWMPYSRLVNATVMRQTEAEYVVAARAMGATNSRIILRHLLPNSVTPAVVLAARDVGSLVVLEAAVAFVGLGGLPWSNVLVSNRDYVIGVGGNPLTYWWTFLPVTLALILFGIGWNLLGDGLNDMLNPRTTF